MKTIWLYWENVYSDEMPDYIRLCYESIVTQAGDWDVVLLTPENVANHVTSLRDDFFEIPEVAHKADYIRGAVLAENGGMWMDIDTIALRPLSLITDLLPLDGSVFYGWKALKPSIGLIAAHAGNPLITSWLSQMDATLDVSLSQKWSGIGYDLLWPLAQTMRYTHIAHTICAPAHYTETGKFLEPIDPSEILKPETVVMQLYNKMFFNTYGKASRDSILGSDTMLAECFARALSPDPSWTAVAEMMTGDRSLLHTAQENSRNEGANIGTSYIKIALEKRESLLRPDQ